MLYEATIEIEVFVFADTPDEARSFLPIAFREELDNMSCCYDADLREAQYVPQEWKDANPYGKETHLTVKQLFDRIQEQRKEAAAYQEYLKRQYKLFKEM